MKEVYYAILALLVLTGCTDTFTITGTSNVSTLDGRKLYLKVLKDTAMKDIDSCDVVHGQFRFQGNVDSVCVGNIILDDNMGLPVVLESGDIQVKIDNTQETVSGTPLNEKLSGFRLKFTQLMNQSMELIHRHDQAIMNGENMAVVNAKLSAQDEAINARMDKLVTQFVTENMNNVLGPYVFINTCMNRYEVPMLDAWIEDIMSKATDHFKNDPLVKDYYEKAQENQQYMNGMKELPPMRPPVGPPMPAGGVPPQDGPTPNQMAAPAAAN